MAIMRKTGDDVVSSKIRKENSKHQPKYKDVNNWLAKPNEMAVIQDGDKLVAIPNEWLDIYKYMAKSLNILHAGVTIGTMKGKDIVPDESLALSIKLNRDAFPTAELSYEEALSYLHRDAITVPADLPRGYVLVAFHGSPLGFVKNLGTRANNLYPAMWKIKSSHFPKEIQ